MKIQFIFFTQKPVYRDAATESIYNFADFNK